MSQTFINRRCELIPKRSHPGLRASARCSEQEFLDEKIYNEQMMIGEKQVFLQVSCLMLFLINYCSHLHSDFKKVQIKDIC